MRAGGGLPVGKAAPLWDRGIADDDAESSDDEVGSEERLEQLLRNLADQRAAQKLLNSALSTLQSLVGKYNRNDFIVL